MVLNSWPHAAVQEAWKRCSLALVPSVWAEPFGIVVLEAMAAGRPVITGIDWSLYPKDPPPVIAAADADGIVAAIEKLRHDEGELARLSRDGREWVRRNHGFERHLQLLEAAYFGPGASS